MNDAALSQSRLQVLLAVYGSRPERWPECERDAAIELLESLGTAQTLAREQHVLDAWLAKWNPPALSSEVVRRLNAIPEKQGTGTLSRRWGMRALWVPAFGWAAAAAIGVWLGARAASADGEMAPSAVVEYTVAQQENIRLARSSGALDELEEP